MTHSRVPFFPTLRKVRVSSRKLITAARVATGPDGRCVEDGAVLTDGDTVVAAGRRTEVEALADERDERITLPGTTVLPGIVDAHVHLVFDALTDLRLVVSRGELIPPQRAV